MICAGRMVAGRQYERTARDVILDALRTENLTAWEMADRAERAHQTIMTLLKKLRAEKSIHVADWRIQRTGPHVAVYGIGNFEDAPKPAVKTNAEKCLAYSRRRSIPKPKDPILRALMGMRP